MKYTAGIVVLAACAAKEGENPDNIELNLVIDGTGTAWIDAIELFRGPAGNI